MRSLNPLKNAVLYGIVIAPLVAGCESAPYRSDPSPTQGYQQSQMEVPSERYVQIQTYISNGKFTPSDIAFMQEQAEKLGFEDYKQALQKTPRKFYSSLENALNEAEAKGLPLAVYPVPH